LCALGREQGGAEVVTLQAGVAWADIGALYVWCALQLRVLLSRNPGDCMLHAPKTGS
jgi:hypothetical protein